MGESHEALVNVLFSSTLCIKAGGGGLVWAGSSSESLLLPSSCTLCGQPAPKPPAGSALPRYVATEEIRPNTGGKKRIGCPTELQTGLSPQLCNTRTNARQKNRSRLLVQQDMDIHQEKNTPSNIRVQMLQAQRSSGHIKVQPWGSSSANVAHKNSSLAGTFVMENLQEPFLLNGRLLWPGFISAARLLLPHPDSALCNEIRRNLRQWHFCQRNPPPFSPTPCLTCAL